MKMDKREKQILQLQRKMELLIRNQESIRNDIRMLQVELNRLTGTSQEATSRHERISEKQPDQGSEKTAESTTVESGKEQIGALSRFPALAKINLEEFIGGNLINKIGIIILIAGVGIGVKFAIDHELISPLVRLIIGYLIGFALLFFSFRTRINYKNFSAVLASGSLATIYFITYAGCSYYSLIPLTIAYILMVAITIYAVYISLKYDREIIALIGLVGAYAIPFLLGRETENYRILFAYITIINAGILVVSVKKYWKWLLYGAFLVTWFLFLSWLKNIYVPESDFGISILFGFIFFAFYYVTILIPEFLRNGKISVENSILLITNSFIFYGVGYFSFSSFEPAEPFSGIFTLSNSILYFLTFGYLVRTSHPDKNLRMLLIGLSITFITIFFPVQFESNWITFFWFIEALALFYIGRISKTSIYEYSSYVIIVLGFYSLLNDFSTAYISYSIDDTQSRLSPFFNRYFMTSFIALIGIGLINFVHFSKRFGNSPLEDPTLKSMVDIGLAGILIFIGYYTFRNEIAVYWNQLYLDSEVPVPLQSESGGTYLLRDPNLRLFKIIWIHIYGLLFFACLTAANAFVVKFKYIVPPAIVLNSLVVLAFLLQGLLVLSDLRENYLNSPLSTEFNAGSWNIGIRYIALIAVFGLTLFNRWYAMKHLLNKTLFIIIDLFTYLVFLWVISSEWIHWKDVYGASESYKIGLSILWGIFSLLLVAIGIWKRKKYLRIGAISIFGITLLKLFFYDLIDLNTISKTIVFVSLGILLLIISFLYNKYRKVLFD
jgi:uncharacterized membrane protein